MTASGHASPSAVVGSTVALTALAGLTVFARLYTRFVIVKKAGLDDLCISVSIVFAIVVTITMCEQVNYGMGRHFVTLSDHDRVMLLKWFWASVWIYYTSLCFTKVSILLQYLRVFPHYGFRIACYVLMGIVVAYSIGTVFSSIFSCVPVPYFWNKTLEGHCVDETAVWFSNTSINIVTDICTAILPISSLKSLQLPKRQKYALMAVFGLGGFTCVISILRLQSLYVVSHTDDITWDNPLAAIWSNTEMNVGIICSCLPTLKGLVQRIFPRLFPNSHTGWSSNHYDTRSSFRSAPKRSRASYNAMDHELTPREKGMSNSRVGVGVGWGSGAPGAINPTPPMEYESDKHIAVHTLVEQDIARRNNELPLGETESTRRLTLPSYRMA